MFNSLIELVSVYIVLPLIERHFLNYITIKQKKTEDRRAGLMDMNLLSSEIQVTQLV